jgi:peroxiredoxin
MTIKVGDRLPAGSLSEFIEVETAGCTLGPNEFKVEDLTRGKKVVLFGLPGAFTPTCSAKHVPSYIANYDKLKARGVNDILCMSVNDAFVMGAWAKDQKSAGKVRMEGDAAGRIPRRLAWSWTLSPAVLRAVPALLGADRGRRGQGAQHRGARKYEVSGAETTLSQLG